MPGSAWVHQGSTEAASEWRRRVGALEVLRGGEGVWHVAGDRWRKIVRMEDPLCRARGVAGGCMCMVTSSEAVGQAAMAGGDVVASCCQGAWARDGH